METRAIHVDANTEIGEVKHNELNAYAYGFVRTADRLTAYLGKDAKLTKWDGTEIGTYRITSSWPTPRSFVSSHMNQVLATLHDGTKWTGRSAGVGMVFTGRAKRTRRA